jgi:hypothetical protein
MLSPLLQKALVAMLSHGFFLLLGASVVSAIPWFEKIEARQNAAASCSGNIIYSALRSLSASEFCTDILGITTSTVEYLVYSTTVVGTVTTSSTSVITSTITLSTTTYPISTTTLTSTGSTRVIQTSSTV